MFLEADEITTTLHYTTLHYTTLHYTTLHYTTLHYTTLHYTTLHYMYRNGTCTKKNKMFENVVEANAGQSPNYYRTLVVGT